MARPLPQARPASGPILGEKISYHGNKLFYVQPASEAEARTLLDVFVEEKIFTISTTSIVQLWKCQSHFLAGRVPGHLQRVGYAATDGTGAVPPGNPEGLGR